VALSGLHDTFMLALRRMRTDVTYNQSDLLNIYKDRLSKYKFIGSSDLTAFTDRFPREFMSEVIAAKYGAVYAEIWTNIISNREFTFKDKKVKYSVGNPMGLLSS
jgi:hypothetical protein